MILNNIINVSISIIINVTISISINVSIDNNINVSINIDVNVSNMDVDIPTYYLVVLNQYLRKLT